MFTSNNSIGQTTMLQLKSLIFVGLTISSILSFAGTSYGQEREWVDSTGNFKIVASYEKLEDEQLFLRKPDGKSIKIPFAKLSLADQAHVRELIRAERVKNGTLVLDSNESIGSGSKTNPPENKAPLEEKETAKPDTTSNSGTTKKTVLTALTVEGPGEKLEFLEPAELEFQSAIDINEINSLPQGIRELAQVLHERPNVIEMGETFISLSQQNQLPPVVIQLLQESSVSNNRYLRIQSIKLLAQFDPKESFDQILAALTDRSFNVRWSALELVEYLGDERAIDPLIANFPGRDRSKILTVLATFGPSIEEKVFPLLDHENRTVVTDAIRLLVRIGTQKSVEKITPFLQSDRTSFRMQAKTAIEKIQKRIQQ